MPSIVKLEHHHEHFVCNAKNEKHFHQKHENCSVCSFEFLVFLTEKNYLASANIDLTDNCNIRLYVCQYSALTKYSFLLRAPPVLQNFS